MSEVGPTAVTRCMEIRSEGATPRSDVGTSAHFGDPHQALQGPKFATGPRSGDTTHFGTGDVTICPVNRRFTRPESTQTRSICDHRQANRNKGVDTPVGQLPRQRASVGSIKALFFDGSRSLSDPMLGPSKQQTLRPARCGGSRRSSAFLDHLVRQSGPTG
jgi:hypothetical protein